MTINSQEEFFKASPEKVYNFLTGLTRNVQVPSIPEISNWSQTETGCQFTLMNMLNCALQLSTQTPCSEIGYSITTDKGMAAKASFSIHEKAGGSMVQLTTNLDVPMLMQPMIKGPLQQGLGRIMQKLKEQVELL